LSSQSNKPEIYGLRPTGK